MLWLYLLMVAVRSSHIHSDLLDASKLSFFPQNYPHRLFAGQLNITQYKSFYYFLCQSQSSPLSSPTIIWFNGGPGCSSLLSMFYSHGPFKFHRNTSELFVNPYSWNKVANVVYLQSPAGAGFSNGDQSQVQDDETVAEDNLRAVRKLLERYGWIAQGDLYLAGESYAGIYVPYLAKKILEFNQNAQYPINLKGIKIASPCTHPTECARKDIISFHVIEYLYRRGFISEQDWQRHQSICFSSKKSSDSEDCFKNVQHLTNLFQSLGIDPQNIHQPCVNQSFNGKFPALRCSDVLGALILLNNNENRKALNLNIPNNTLMWEVCNPKLKYQILPQASYWIYPILVEAGLKILIESGEEDAAVPMTGTLFWLRLFIQQQGKELMMNWTPWFLDGRKAGSVWELGRIKYITYSQAGHAIASYKPKQSFVILEDFLK